MVGQSRFRKPFASPEHGTSSYANLLTHLEEGCLATPLGDGDRRPCPIFVSPGRQADMNPQARETKKPTKDKGMWWVPGVPGLVSGGPEGGVRGVGGMEGSDLAPLPGAMEHYMRA